MISYKWWEKKNPKKTKGSKKVYSIVHMPEKEWKQRDNTDEPSTGW